MDCQCWINDMAGLVMAREALTSDKTDLRSRITSHSAVDTIEALTSPFTTRCILNKRRDKFQIEIGRKQALKGRCPHRQLLGSVNARFGRSVLDRFSAVINLLPAVYEKRLKQTRWKVNRVEVCVEEEYMGY